MPRGGIFFILLIFMSVGLLTLLWPMIPTAEKIARHQISIFNSKKSQPLEKTVSALVPLALLAEATRSGQLDSDPVASEKRLEELAGKLSDSEIKAIAQIAKEPSSDGDLRSLAVDLLARTKSETALQPLEEVIVSKWSAAADPRLVSFEQALRARAIEGLEAHPSLQATQILQEALSQTNDLFLNDHGQRALLHRQGQARSVEEQDQEALRRRLRQ